MCTWPARRQRRLSFGLHGQVRAIRQPVHHSVDSHIPQREEHVQAAHRLPDQRRPHLELDHEPRRQRLAEVPPDVHLQSAEIVLYNLGWRQAPGRRH
jgi:hypothetical protein